MVNKSIICAWFILCLVVFNACKTDINKQVEFIHQDSLYIIPKPTLIEKREGYFKIDKNTFIDFASDCENEGNYLNQLIAASSNFELQRNIDAKIKPSEIELKIVYDFPKELQNGESYRMIIAENRLQITALTSTGIMRGIQTLRQLFVHDFHAQKKRDAWYIPCLKIEDVPKFEHRGFLFDVCRHYFDKAIVLKYIDLMALYKMNVLHFHLTEDQGWRMPIESYPKLNQISSFRTEKDGSTYGGFYSKDDLKEIVAYAKERHIVVIPEIEMPGHAQAALSAYPQFSCIGKDILVANDWGVFKEIYCAGNDSTFLFIETILKEVMEIFPSEYIHIGGDEAPKFRWDNCAKCQKRMQKEGLKDEHELQSYFINRIEKFLNENGRKIIGWDEILEGGLSPNATVQSWRGMEGGKTAAEQKHYVIMSPTSHCYLDYGLDQIDLKKIYAFNPIPSNLEAEFHPYILGAECNMWTEHVEHETILDNKVFPRLIGLAEALWTGPDTNRYEDFYARLQKHYLLLESKNVEYGYEAIPFTLATQLINNKLWVNIALNLPKVEIEYRFKNDKDTNWIKYTKPFEILNQVILEIKTTKHNKSFGDMFEIALANHQAVFKKVFYFTDYNEWYKANNEVSLVDGQLGSLNFRDGNWQGFWGNNCEVLIDLNSAKKINSIQANFLAYSNAWIMEPRGIEVWFGMDSTNFQPIQNVAMIPVNAFSKDGISINPVRLKFAEVSARFLKIKITNYGKLPASHEAAGQDAWLFIDEIIVN